MKKRLFTVIVVLAVATYSYFTQETRTRQSTEIRDTGAPQAQDGRLNDSAVMRAFKSRRSGQVLEFSGVVDRLLADDDDGSRHQRFIVRGSDGMTVLISHNIDLAPRVDALGLGDAIVIRGEYEWNDRGGLIHWTHHDPRGLHEAGWIRHEGREYQ